MRWLILLVRISGVVLGASAVLKLIDLDPVAAAFVHYGLPGAISVPAVVVLCVLELAVAAWAIAKPRQAAPAVMLVFTTFTAWHIAMGVLTDEAECPCMGFSLLGKGGPQLALAPLLALFAIAAFFVAARSKRTSDKSASPSEAEAAASREPSKTE
jgi:hypothetical protein